MKLECFWCDVPLEWSEERREYKCNECGGRWVPGPRETSDDIIELWNSEQAYKKSISAKGGGSRSSGRREKLPKPLTTERYRLY